MRRSSAWLRGALALLLTIPTMLAAMPAGEDPTGPFSAATTQFDFARGLLSRNLHGEAEEEFTKFLQQFPNDPRVAEAVLWRGEARFAGERFKESSVDFYTYLTKHRDVAQRKEFARLRYGCALFELGLHDQTVTTLTPLTTAPGVDAALRETALYYLGLSQTALGKHTLAAEALEKVTTGALAADALYELAEVAAAEGDHDKAARLFGQFLTRFADSARRPRAALRRAEEWMAAGNLDAAAQGYEALAKAETAAADARVRARYGLAWVRYAQNNFKAARELAAEVARAGVAVPTGDARYLEGIAAMRMNDFAAAEASFARVQDGSRLREAALKQAWAHLAAGNHDAALQAVLSARKRFQDLPAGEAEYLVGKALAGKQEYEAALDHLRQARDLQKACHAEAAFDYGSVLARLGRHADAAVAFDYVVRTFPGHARRADALLQQGQALMSLDKHVEAIPIYEVVVDIKGIDPERLEIALHQQAVCFYHMKQFANMKRVYEDLLKRFPKGRSAPEACYWLAWYEHEEKRYARAASLYESLYKTFPRHELAPKARYRRAMSLFHDGQEGEAAEALYEIVTQFPHTLLDQKELLWLGQFYMDRRRFEQALQVFDALLQGKPTREARSLAFYFQAEALRRQDQWDAALKKYERLLSEEQTGLESAAEFGRASCLRKLGKLVEAREALARCGLQPDDPLTAHYHAELGYLDLAEKKFEAAASHLLRVGLLYDNEDLCGEALLAAGEACLATGDLDKARVCFGELAGLPEDSFGRRYPESRFTKLGKEKLAALGASAEARTP